MAISTFRLRTGALAAAAGLVLAGFAVASPAAAEEVPAPVIELDQTSFPAGDWEDGFTVTGSGFTAGADVNLQLSISSGPSSGEGATLGSPVVADAAGNISTHVTPTNVAVIPDADGYPKYSVGASQSVDGANVYSNWVALTITAGTSITLPDAVSPESLAAGITVKFAGFQPGEAVRYSGELFVAGDLTVVDGEAAADDAGAGSFVLALAGAKVGDGLHINLAGQESERAAEAYVSVTEAQAPVVPAPAAPAPAATGPQLAETGVELGIGFAALALMVLGAGAIVVTRRVRGAQR
ncbi:hypothetical protein [Agromyces laixinhei]|uniref:hypothetical protein n=1 Tax=Agromyces laixinhei TaxID=2585717 RepID=UPI001117491D|nr:hypothetical protein [Agromyces laixinhei]